MVNMIQKHSPASTEAKTEKSAIENMEFFNEVLWVKDPRLSQVNPP